MANIPLQEIAPDGAWHTLKNAGADLTPGTYAVQGSADFYLSVNSADPSGANNSGLLVKANSIHPIEILAGEKAWVRCVSRTVFAITT